MSFRCIMSLSYRVTFLCNVLCQIHYTSESPVRFLFYEKNCKVVYINLCLKKWMLHLHLSYCKLASILLNYLFYNRNYSYLQLSPLIHLPQPLLFCSYPQYLLQISHHCLNINIYLFNSTSTITYRNLSLNTLFRVIFLSLHIHISIQRI